MDHVRRSHCGFWLQNFVRIRFFLSLYLGSPLNYELSATPSPIPRTGSENIFSQSLVPSHSSPCACLYVQVTSVKGNTVAQ